MYPYGKVVVFLNKCCCNVQGHEECWLVGAFRRYLRRYDERLRLWLGRHGVYHRLADIGWTLGDLQGTRLC